MAGLPKLVPFLKAPLSLHVGQTVRFRILSRGDDVQAVDISLESEVPGLQEREMQDVIADTNDLNTSSTLGTTVEKPKSLDSVDVSLVPAQSHSRCFLRRMGQFRNSSQGEQLQLVIEAERSLEKLLGQSALDGDAICRLARKCASWLHPPVLKTANPQRKTDHKSASGTEDQVHLQERIRKIVIEALNNLDLQDPSTFEAMKAALFYMASLCQRLDEKSGFSSGMLAATTAGKQWLELKSLLADSGRKSLDEMSCQPPCPRVEDQPKPSLFPSSASSQGQGKEMADAVRLAGVEHENRQRRRTTEFYEPTELIKAMSTVSQGTEVKLMCSECPFTMGSSWYFESPRTLKRWVMAPQDGHKTCRQKVKNCYWKSLDNLRVMRAVVSNLKYCKHNLPLRSCASCGGYQMCIHAKQKHQCRECRHLVRRRGTKRC